jgi:hypothetical protein
MSAEARRGESRRLAALATAPEGGIANALAAARAEWDQNFE